MGILKTSKLLKKPSSLDLKKTVTWKNAPSWSKENPYILRGYRKAQYSYKGCIDSLYYLHNESGNIYTHLIGAMVFVATWIVAYHLHLTLITTSNVFDYVVLGIFLFGIVACLSLSACFHLFCCHSLDISREWNKLDYIGIVVLIVSSFFPPVYYGFYCQPHLQAFYLSTITIFGYLTISITASNKYCKPEFKVIRTGLFTILGFCGLFPVGHGIVQYGYWRAREAMSLDYIFLMGAFYVFGAYIYVSRVPEKWFPGRFDYFVGFSLIINLSFIHINYSIA